MTARDPRNAGATARIDASLPVGEVLQLLEKWQGASLQRFIKRALASPAKRAPHRDERALSLALTSEEIEALDEAHPPSSR